NDHNASARSRGLIATDRAILDVRWAVVRKDCAARVAAIVCTYPPSHGIVVEGTIMDGQSAAVVENGAAEGSAAATAAVAAIPTEATTGAGTRPAHALTISSTTTKAAATAIAAATVTISATTTTAEAAITTIAGATATAPTTAVRPAPALPAAALRAAAAAAAAAAGSVWILAAIARNSSSSSAAGAAHIAIAADRAVTVKRAVLDYESAVLNINGATRAHAAAAAAAAIAAFHMKAFDINIAKRQPTRA